jgi:hypothetical protein
MSSGSTFSAHQNQVLVDDVLTQLARGDTGAKKCAGDARLLIIWHGYHGRRSHIYAFVYATTAGPKRSSRDISDMTG